MSLGFEPYWVEDRDAALWTYKQGMPLIAISNWLNDQIAAHTHQRGHVVPLGVDTSVFRPAIAPREQRDRKVIMYIARNPDFGYALKGFHDFQEAIEQVRQSYHGDFVVHMVCPEGDLSLPGIPYEIFHPTSEHEMAELYRTADVFVSSSWFEAFALPPLEAMACGTPVVSTNSGGLLDYCTHLKNAILTQPKNPEELAAGIIRVLNDEELAAQLAKEGTATASRFTKETYLQNMIRTLEEIERDRTRHVEPKVSIVIPFYNSPYIDHALASALGQTYSNLEIIVVDDGSTLYTDKIAPYRRYIRYIRKENGGTATALNTGIRHATGDYISWLSSDDEFTPDKTIKQVRFMQERGEMISHGAFIYMNERNEAISEPIRTTFANETEFYKTMREWCPINGCTIMIDRRVFDEIGLFDESLPYAHDYELWLRALPHYHFGYLNDPIVRYRVHSEMGTKRHERAIQKEVFVIQEKYKEGLDRLIDKEEQL